ncbi:MAG: biopolymer transporter ExbD [Campylobacterales bacterium]
MDDLRLDDNPDLNITPLVDIMLVLLAILMVTIPAVVYEEQINLPKSSKTKQIDKQPKIEIAINSKGEIIYDKNSYNKENFADSFIMASNSLQRDQNIYIRADRALEYGFVMYVLKTIKEAGFTKVSLVTDG